LNKLYNQDKIKLVGKEEEFSNLSTVYMKFKNEVKQEKKGLEAKVDIYSSQMLETK